MREKGKKNGLRMQRGEKTPASHSRSKLMTLAKKIQTDPAVFSSKSKSLTWWPLRTNCSLTPVKTSVHLPSLNFSFFRKLLQVPETVCPDNCMQLRKPPVVEWDEVGGREAGRQGEREREGGGRIHFLQEHNSFKQQQKRCCCCCCCEAVAIWCLLKSRHQSSRGSSRSQPAAQATYMNALMQAVLAQIN